MTLSGGRTDRFFYKGSIPFYYIVSQYPDPGQIPEGENEIQLLIVCDAPEKVVTYYSISQ